MPQTGDARNGSPRPVVCIGGAVWESIFSVDAIPGRGVKLLPREARQLASGMAASAAATIARLGHPVELWALAGNDATGHTMKTQLAREGIDVEHLRLVAGATTFSTILVDRGGERLVVPYFDPALHGAVADIPVARLHDARAVLADVRWAEGALAALSLARACGVPTVLDADVAPLPVLELLLPLADHLLFSEPALRMVVDKSSPQAALRRLAAGLPRARVIGVTLGEQGAVVLDRDADVTVWHHPACPIRAIDTLNAGDVWHGAYVYGLVTGLGLHERVQFAHAAAAIKCERAWGRLGAPWHEEVMVRLEATPPPAAYRLHCEEAS